MGNTPSQGGFHLPDELAKGQSQSNHGQDRVTSNQKSKPSEATLDNLVVDRPVNLNPSVDPSSNQNRLRNAKALVTDPTFSPNASSAPIQFNCDPSSRTLDNQPYSMDSLAIDTSSINTISLSPSSLSPEESHEPLGHLTVSLNENFHPQKHKDLFSFTKSRDMDNISAVDVIKYGGDEILNQFDSLDDPSINVDKVYQSFSSSVGNLIPIEKGVDIVTVNGLNMPTDFPEILQEYSKIVQPVSISKHSTSSSLNEHHNNVSNSPKNIVNPSCNDSKSTESEIPRKKASEPDTTTEEKPGTSANDASCTNSNQVDLARSGSSTTKTDFLINEDDETAKTDVFSGNVSVVDITSECKSRNDEEGFTEGPNHGTFNLKLEYNSSMDNTVSTPPGNGIFIVSDQNTLQRGYEPESTDHKNVVQVNSEIESVYECTQPEENPFVETVVVSNLIFVDGPNNEEGHVITQVCLQSSEENVNFQKPSWHIHDDSAWNNSEKSNNAGKTLFQNEPFPNYYMGNVDKSSKNEVLEANNTGCGYNDNKESKILSLVMSSNRSQFRDIQTKTDTTNASDSDQLPPPICQEICESWDEIEHNFDQEHENEVKVVSSNDSKYLNNDALNSESKMLVSSNYNQCKDDSKAFNKTVHRESLADFEQLEEAILRMEAMNTLSSPDLKAFSATSSEVSSEVLYLPSDTQSSCMDDSTPKHETFKEGPDYELMSIKKETNEGGGSYDKSQDREMEEESINFHKEAANTYEPKEKLLLNNLVQENCSGMSSTTSKLSQKDADANDSFDSNYSVKGIIMKNQIAIAKAYYPQGIPSTLDYSKLTDTDTLIPKTNNEGSQFIKKDEKVEEDLHLVTHSGNNSNFGITTDSTKASAITEPSKKLQHISKVYVCTEEASSLPPIIYPVVLSTSNVTHPVVQTPGEVENLFSDEPKSVHFEANEIKSIDNFEENIIEEQDQFFVEIAGNQKPKSKSVKKFSKPPRIISNLRKSTILKRKEPNSNNISKDDAFSSVEIFDSSSRKTNNSSEIISSETSKPSKTFGPSRYKVSKLELSSEDKNTNSEAKDKPQVITPCDKMDSNPILINLDSGLESEISSSRSTSSSGDQNHNITGISEISAGTLWAATSDNIIDTMEYNFKRPGSLIFEGSHNNNSSINMSIGSDCSTIFLPQNHSTPCHDNETPNTTNAIFQEIRKRENRKTDENGNNDQNFGLGMKKSRKEFKPPPHSLLRQSDDNLMSSGVGVGVDKDKRFMFSDKSENKNSSDNRLSMPSEDQDEEESPRDTDLLPGRRGHIMSPALSNEFMVMNGVTEGHTDVDALSLNPVEDALSVQEEQFSRQLQEKENYINELQNNLESLKLKSTSDTDYKRVLAEYEKTMSTYVQKIDEMNKKLVESEYGKVDLIKERDQALEDLRNVESAFSDVHRKYERAKGLLENLKMNEETLIRRDQELMQKIQNRDMKIEALKEKAQDSLEQMHMDYENRIKDFESENTRLRAQYRMMEMKLESAERDVEQKAKENAQLSALCDELINGQVIN